MEGALSQMATLLAAVAAGYAAAGLGYLDDYVKERLTKLLLNVTLPCMMLASVGDVNQGAAGVQIPWAFTLAAAQFFLLLATGALCNAVLRVPRSERRIYLFMSVCTNTGFIGLPVVAAVLGDGSIILSSIFIMVISLFLYSIGFALLAPRERGRLSIPWRSAVNPAMAGCLLAIALFLLGVRLPPLVEGALDVIGGVTAPIAMMLVGVIMKGARLRDVATEWRLYPYIAIRQLIVPAALFLALRLIVPDATALGVFVLMFAMPVGSMAPMFAGQFGWSQELPAKGTVLSTASSFVVVPVLVLYMASF